MKNDLLTAPQKEGAPLQAADVKQKVTGWLKSIGCMEAVGDDLVTQYAMAVGRWRQSETALSTYGLIAKGKGGVTESPYIAIAERYQKQSVELWTKINRIVRIYGAAKPYEVKKSMRRYSGDGYYKRTAYAPC